MSAGNMVIVTKGSAVLSTYEADLEGLDRCTHEEAEFPYMLGMPQYMHGSKSIMFKAYDNDIPVIALSVLPWSALHQCA